MRQAQRKRSLICFVVTGFAVAVLCVGLLCLGRLASWASEGGGGGAAVSIDPDDKYAQGGDYVVFTGWCSCEGCNVSFTWSGMNAYTDPPQSQPACKRTLYGSVGSTPGHYPVTVTCSTPGHGHADAAMHVCRVGFYGFSVDPTYALGPDCTDTNHWSLSQAVPYPNDVGPLVFMIEDPAYKASIGPMTGIVHPACDKSGEITVKAILAIYPPCYEKDNLLIKAHPDGVETAWACLFNKEGFYGAEWTQKLSSTGGSLEDMWVSERVTLGDPNHFNWTAQQAEYYPVPPEQDPDGVHQWHLDASGAFDDDFLLPYADPDMVNATLFWPDPDFHAPKVSRRCQEYCWWCPLCECWDYFTAPKDIDVILSSKLAPDPPQQELDMEVTTSAYGKSVQELYQGTWPPP